MPPDQARPKARRSFFKYGRCSHSELLRFLKDRTGVTFDKKTNRAKLTSRLRELDRSNKFTRFSKLPPELRLRVYEHLLAPDEELTEHAGTQPPCSNGFIHTAVLRTSKAIYNEAKPVLYDKNRFQLLLGSDHSHGYTLAVERPGRNVSYTDHSRDNYYSWVLHSKVATPMFRGLKRLTIILDLGQALVFRRAPAHSSAEKASRIITRLCLFMCGDSRLKELTFSLAPHNKSSEVPVSALPHVFWPVILLRSTVVVRFEGVSGILGSSQPEQSERESQRALLQIGTAEKMCKLVAQIRSCCEAGRAKARADNAVPAAPVDHGTSSSTATTDDRFRIYRKPKPGDCIWIGDLVRRLAPLATIVDTVDIASGSTRWKMLQDLTGEEGTEI